MFCFNLLLFPCAQIILTGWLLQCDSRLYLYLYSFIFVFAFLFVLVFDFVWMTKAMQGSISVTGSCNRADFTVWSTTEPKLIVHKEYVLPFHLSSLWMSIIHWNAARAQVFTKYEAKANIKSHLEQILSHWITAIRFGLSIFKSTSGHVCVMICLL